MNPTTVFRLGNSLALDAACRILTRKGISITQKPTAQTTHLLLPVPSFDADGNVHGGGNLEEALNRLPDEITVIGGHLMHPLLAGYHKEDLLLDEWYLADNSMLTAEGAVQLAAARLPVCISGCPVLVIGWGRIGKCLSQLLRTMGAEVWVAVRKEQDFAIVHALGYRSIFIDQIHTEISHWQVIFNTAPSPVLSEKTLSNCREGALKIDLASRRGLESADVIWARGIPGKFLPESSGQLIADGVMRILQKGAG